MTPPNPRDTNPLRRPTGGVRPGTSPLRKAHAEEAPAGKRIALVDDDRLVTAMVSKFLKKRGFRVRAFNDPLEALDVLLRDHPDAAVVDMQMPGISGMQLVARLIRRLRGLPFPLLFLSSVEEERTFQDAFKLGVSDYLVKPVTEAELATKLEKAIDRHQKAKELPEQLGSYRLLDLVRKSDYSLVYRVEARSRERGLKVLRPEVIGSTEAVLRLHREIDVLAACDHPGIMALNDSGVQDEFLWYVTDAFPLRSLGREVSESGGIDKKGVLSALRVIGGALEHLHERGILVGDLTPESLGRRSNGRLVLTELGSARWLSKIARGDEPAPPHSRYLAPEVFADDANATFTADIYSLGVVLIESYARRAAVRNRTSQTIDVAALTEGLPPPLVQLLARMVHPDPAQRLPSASALVDELDTIVGI